MSAPGAPDATATPDESVSVIATVTVSPLWTSVGPAAMSFEPVGFAGGMLQLTVSVGRRVAVPSSLA